MEGPNIPRKCSLCNKGELKRMPGQLLLFKYDDTEAVVETDKGTPVTALCCNLCGYIVLLSSLKVESIE
ncbi:MAG: hypothetical protein GY845_37320 [Planctomycetes bacterium]|nr:hypothetical protein [Planctomycetota bacterium]